MLKKRKKIGLLAVGLGLLLWGCAKEGYPSGGPKDVAPPVVQGSMPENGTINFDTKEFLVNFDEYVQVKDADNNILVSPPLKQKPEYTTRGRGILVKIKDTLLENTTYLFQFKGGIADYNEGNVLPSYEYVFSTGDVIDSMTVRGTVRDAFTAKPHEDVVTVVAYAEAQLMADSVCPDSVVAKVKPMYMTRTDKEGKFELNHMREGRYRILALDDADKNLLLNPGEAVAFLDTLVTAVHMPAPIDTTAKDSATADSTMADTALVSRTQVTLERDTVEIVPVLLQMSQLKKEVQRVAKAEFLKKGKLAIVTQCPLSQDYTLRHLDSADTSRLYVYPNRKGDTLTVWTSGKDFDSVVLVLHDTNLNDTLKLQFRAKAQPKIGNKNLPESSMKSLVAANHPYYDTLRVAFERPIAGFADSTADSVVAVFDLTDSVISHCGIAFYDSCTAGGYTKAMILFKGKCEGKYRFTLPKGVLRDVYGSLNADSLVINTQYDKAETYGNIFLTVSFDTVGGRQIVLQLINENGDALRQHILTDHAKVAFEHLKAGKYGIRAIIDTDHNKAWTPGDYWQHRQPERVIYFDKILELRENWDMEERWGIVDPD